MDRNFLASVAGGILGLSSLGALGFVFVGGPGGAAGATPGRPEGEWRLLDPVTYENIAIFPVVTGNARDTSWFLTLDEGLASGDVLIQEQGSEGMVRRRDGAIPLPRQTGASVNQLVLVNRSKRPLLLLAGELVSGGKQDRIIGKDRLVPAASEPLPLDVFCVEHGRWSAGASFTDAKTIVHPSVREQATFKKDQSYVWSAVRAGTTAKPESRAGMTGAPPPPPAALAGGIIDRAIREEAPTESYQKIYTSRVANRPAESYVEAIERKFARETAGLKGEQVVGVVVAYGGEVAWSDIFASGELFQAYWNKLLHSYVVEALARPGYRDVALRSDANDFLRRLNGRIEEETEPGVYRWRQINEGRRSQIELDALEPKTIMLHRLLIERTS